MAIEPRVLASHEVILYYAESKDGNRTQEGCHSLDVINYRSNDIAYPQQLMNHLARESKLAGLLANLCSAEVILLDKIGWQKGKVTLALVFYPEEESTPCTETPEPTDLL